MTIILTGHRHIVESVSSAVLGYVYGETDSTTFSETLPLACPILGCNSGSIVSLFLNLFLASFWHVHWFRSIEMGSFNYNLSTSEVILIGFGRWKLTWEEADFMKTARIPNIWRLTGWRECKVYVRCTPYGACNLEAKTLCASIDPTTYLDQNEILILDGAPLDILCNQPKPTNHTIPLNQKLFNLQSIIVKIF